MPKPKHIKQQEANQRKRESLAYLEEEIKTAAKKIKETTSKVIALDWLRILMHDVRNHHKLGKELGIDEGELFATESACIRGVDAAYYFGRGLEWLREVVKNDGCYLAYSPSKEQFEQDVELFLNLFART